ADTMMRSRAGIDSDLFRFASARVCAAEDRPKPTGERLRKYAPSLPAPLSKSLLDPEPVYPDLEKLVLGFSLSKLRENLTADASGTKTFLGKDSPENLAERLAGSKLGDPAVRKALWDGGMAAIRASDDPMI